MKPTLTATICLALLALATAVVAQTDMGAQASRLPAEQQAERLRSHVPIQNSITLIVDTANPQQPILGFGASACWWAQTIGAWPDDKRREVIRLLFDKKTGLGLTIYRHNLGADTLDDTTIPRPDRRAESMLDTKATPPRFDWSRDANARRVMREAVEAGVTEVILFANSPPVNMTKNKRGYPFPDPRGKQPDGEHVSNFALERHADFAAYLGEITEHFLCVEKLPVVALSPLNEPEWEWSKAIQEGCSNSPAETAAILRATHDELKRRNLPVRVEGPEGGSWKSAIPYFEAIGNDPELRATMKDIAIHSYWSDNNHRKTLRAWLDKNRPGIRLHMTEWCEMKRGYSPGMDGALTLARTIIDDFTLGGVVTWQYWVAVHPPVFYAGMLYFDDDKPEYQITKRHWVFAQFTRYLEKGSVVLPLKTQTPAPRLRAMAAHLPDGRVAVICANLSDAEKSLDIEFPASETWRQQYRSLTDETYDNTTTPASNVLPAHGVVTMIFEKQ